MTYAVNINELTIWPVDTLADMQARKRRFEDMATAADINNEPGIAAMYQAAADREERNIALHEHWIANRAARIQHDRLDVAEADTRTGINWGAVGIACLIVAAFAFVIGDGIARAFERPAGCETLSAYECAAAIEEARR